MDEFYLYIVGIAIFFRCFKEKYGMTSSQYRKKQFHLKNCLYPYGKV